MQLSLATHADLIAKARRAREEHSRSNAGTNAALGMVIGCAVGLALWTLIIAGLWAAFS